MNQKLRKGSPSAIRREHVRGRWLYKADLSNAREHTIHTTKQLVGFLIPWLMLALPFFLATSRAATEIASWGLAFLTLLYVATDAFARHREFRFFRLGPDLSLAACLFFGILSIVANLAQIGSGHDAISLILKGLGHLRWIPLLYLFVYAWELFPGLNRVVTVLVGTVATTALLVWVQHFQGVDWLTGEALPNAPTGRIPFFVPKGFFGSTEALATLFACVLPFPVAAACLRKEREGADRLTWIGFGISVVIALALFFTYRPGFWWAGATGILTLLIFPGERRFKLLASIAAAITAVWLILFIPYGSSQVDEAASSTHASVLERINAEEAVRNEQHRLQMNLLVKIWESAPLLGIAGAPLLTPQDADATTPPVAARYDSVNVYFLILARSGLIGLGLYLAFVLHHLLNTLRLFYEIPESHHRHRVLVAGCFASQCAFHVAGLYWGTMTEAFSMNLFILVSSITLYMNEHYTHGLVSDDSAL
ncbi:MAG: O-antigen ligase family protein [Bdellovibrionales bacterium]|nr:O-antigen ligase family protein [Bdellovibrionales bacterium]